jgi:hypothetical protein
MHVVKFRARREAELPAEMLDQLLLCMRSSVLARIIAA